MLKISSLIISGSLFVLVLYLCCACQSNAQELKPHAVVHDTASSPVQPTLVADKTYLLGKFDPNKHPDFVKVGAPYTDRPGMMMRKEAFEAFERMWNTAQKEGIQLRIISSTRTFDQQKAIWEGKWTRFAATAPKPKDRALKILEYSSMPGSSRHHWGTDIDLNDLNNPSFESGGKYEKLYAWLLAHAHEYGFCQPYTAGRPSGYHEEKWHWSYQPLSEGFTKAYPVAITEADITGFTGSETASDIQIIQNYVLGINQGCLGKQ
ncbi:MAG: M15 family metallopeptidase [Saprospiraceae bacterium]|nr:M15 family metallopeptidase [Saprospiraceae bacterium]